MLTVSLKNKDIDRKLDTEQPRWGLDEIVNHLNHQKQRATYGAVAKIVGVLPLGLMNGRPKSPKDSWIVASSGPRRGWPTGYQQIEINPDCLRQIQQGEKRPINDEKTLLDWLKSIAP